MFLVLNILMLVTIALMLVVVGLFCLYVVEEYWAERCQEDGTVESTDDSDGS